MQKYLSILFLSVIISITGVAQTELIVNGDFSNGGNNWAILGSYWYTTTTFTCTSSAPGYAYVGTSTGGGANSTVGSIYQQILIPSSANNATLKFKFSINTDETTSANDLVQVQLRDVNMNLLYTFTQLSNLNGVSPSTGCQPYQSSPVFSIPSTYFGQTIRINFQTASNATLPTRFRIDDISVTYTTASCTPVSNGTTQPQSQNISQGSTATFNVSVNGTPPFSYFWYKNGAFTGTSTLNTSNTTNTYTTPPLGSSDDGDTYYCLINNCNDLNQTQSNTATINVTAACTTPTSPSGLSASTVSSSQINLSWTDNSNNENGFEIERSTSPGSSFGYIGSVNGNVNNFSNTTGLSNGITYYYRVRACCNTNCSNYSNEANATTSASVPTVNSITFTNIIENHRGINREFNLYSGNPGINNNPIKICADGSTSTYIKVNVSNISGISFRILNELQEPISNTERDGVLGLQYVFGGNNVEVSFTHPKYMSDILSFSRRFTLQVLYNGFVINGAEYPIDIYRAPIMFVHGLWGDKTSFQGKRNDNGVIFEALRQNMYPYFNSNPDVESRAPLFWFVDYSNINSAAGHFSDYDNTVENEIKDFFFHLRSKGFSCAKVDLICHSMGGIVSRLYLQSLSYKNDVNKFITINTPHNGTQSSNFLLSEDGREVKEFLNQGGFWIAASLLADMPCDLGAIEDLSVQSTAINLLNNFTNSNLYRSNNIPTHVISSSDLPEDCDYWVTCLNKNDDLITKKSTSAYNERHPSNELSPSDFANLLYNGEENDLIVPIRSQQNGASKFSRFENISHSDILDNPYENILSKIKELLTANPNNQNLFGTDGFRPSNLTITFLRPAFGNKLFARNSTNEEYNLSLQVLNEGGINSTDTLKVQVSGSPNLEKIKLTAGNSTYPIVYYSSSESDTAIFSIPLDTAIDGSLFLMAQGYDTSSYVIESHTSKYIQPIALLDSIKLNDDSLEVSINETKKLYITGFYNDNKQREISFPMNLIVSVVDTAILGVDSNLIIHPKNIGQTNIIVSFEGKEDFINVTISNAQEVFNSNFIADNFSVCQGNSIQFENKTRGNATYEWIFEGGTPQTSTASNPLVFYNTPGKYSVTLISHFSSESDTLSVASLIEVGIQNRTIQSGSWNSPETWGCLNIPSLNDSAIIASGDTIIMDASVQIKRLHIESGGLLQINDSSKTLVVGDTALKTSELLSDGELKITNGVLKVNGSVNIATGSSFSMSGGKLIIDGNTGEQSTSIADGQHLFNVNTSNDKFNLSGGTLQFINPPLGANSQTINCPYNFSASTTLMFGDGVSTTASNNPNGFGGNLLPNEIGKLIFDPATSQNNRIFKNLNPLIIRGSCEVRSGNFVQQEYLQILNGININSGLVGKYLFNDNVVDSSGNNNDGTINNGTFFTDDRFGNPNSAIQLDGADDYIGLASGNSTSLNITGDFTVSFWVNTSDNSGSLASLGDNVNVNSGGYLSCINGGNVGDGLVGISTRGNWTGSVNNISDNNWHHVVYSLKNDTLLIYVDNALDKQVTGVLSPLSWNGNRVIGCRSDLIMNAATNYQGEFDDLFIYNRALTPNEINYLFTH